jgi:hypothetical protein
VNVPDVKLVEWVVKPNTAAEACNVLTKKPDVVLLKKVEDLDVEAAETPEAVHLDPKNPVHLVAVLAHLDPRDLDPRDLDPRDLDLRYLEPRYLEPRYLEPRYLVPRYLVPKYLDPRDLVPRDLDPRDLDPRDLVHLDQRDLDRRKQHPAVLVHLVPRDLALVAADHPDLDPVAKYNH